jgi:hypothetical protein
MSSSWRPAMVIVASGLVLLPACERTRSNSPVKAPSVTATSDGSKEGTSPVPNAPPSSEPGFGFFPAPPRDYPLGVDPGYLSPEVSSVPAEPTSTDESKPAPPPVIPAAKKRVELAIKEKSLGKPTEDSKVAVSRDGKRIAYTRTAGTEFVVVVDELKGGMNSHLAELQNQLQTSGESTRKRHWFL